MQNDRKPHWPLKNGEMYDVSLAAGDETNPLQRATFNLGS
jgi:hypothetical protein